MNTIPRLAGKKLQEAVNKYNEFFDDLRKCFVGRDQIIDILRYALIQKQHLLIFGPPGTSKTAIFDVLFSGMTDTNGFHTELSMFMTEDALLGPYNPKKMREDGILEHNIQGMLPEANMARLGEFLDANMPLLRSTLSVLNERRMVRGTQKVQIPLITAYCDTNTDPGVFLEMHPEAWAVFDRFLFLAHVDYLEREEDVIELLERFQSGRVHGLVKKLSLQLINDLSRLTLEPPTIIKNKTILVKLAKALQEYRVERRKIVKDDSISTILPEISDRRFCWATQTAEVNAILDGRDEVMPEDIIALHHVLGTTKEEKDLWNKIATKVIEEIHAEMKMQIDHAQYIALEGLLKDLGRINVALINDVATLQQEGGVLKGIKQNLDSIIPENDTITVQKKKVENEYEGMISALKTKALELTNIG